MTIGFHSPLPPARSGIADYAEALLGALRKRAEVQANPAAGCDAEIYHLGNNQLHRGIYRRAIERPGVVVLHDAVLQHFFLGSLDAEQYVEEFVYNYGEWARDLGRQLWVERARSGQDARYFEYPMLRRICERARAVVVHNPAAAGRVLAHVPRCRVVEIPHLFVEPDLPAGHQVERLRAQLGVAPGAVLFGVFGYLRESKRLPSVLEAFHRVRRQHPETRLLVTGEFASTDLERAVGPLLRSPAIHRRGYLREDEFWLYASAVDAGVSLRYPAAGETSGIAVRMMGIGKTVLVTAGEEVSRFPEASCVRVDPGPAESDMLAAYMLWLAEDEAARREIGRRGAAHIAAEHELERCTDLYWDLLREILGG